MFNFGYRRQINFRVTSVLSYSYIFICTREGMFTLPNTVSFLSFNITLRHYNLFLTFHIYDDSLFWGNSCVTRKFHIAVYFNEA